MREAFTFILIIMSCVLWSITENKEIKTDTITSNDEGTVLNLEAIAPVNENGTDLAKQEFPYRPCECKLLECVCCAGIDIIGVFSRRACAVISYENKNDEFRLELFLNNGSIYSNRISTRNQQVCVPILPVTLVGPFDVCVRLYDVNVVEQRLHACLAMLGRVAQFPVLTLQFNCMELGPGGVALTGPIDGDYSGSGSYPSKNKTTTSTTLSTPQADSGIYDSVSESAPNKTF